MPSPTFDLFLTISGLYLMIVEGERGDPEAERAHVLLPRIHHHQARLSFSLADLDHPKTSGIDHYLGADGTRYGSVTLGERVSMTPAAWPELELLWRPTSTTLSLRQVLDVNQIDLELDPERVRTCPGTRLTFDEGTLYAADLYRGPSRGEPLYWHCGSAEPSRTERVVQLIADDVVLYRSGLAELRIDTGVPGLELRFLPARQHVIRRQRDVVHLCLSNDLVNLQSCLPPRSSVVNFERNSPFIHLGFLTALANVGTQIRIPTLDTSGETPSNPRCNGVQTFQPSSPWS